jgi:hypothetical protein
MKSHLHCLLKPVFKAKGAFDRLLRIWVTSYGKKTRTVLLLLSVFKMLKYYNLKKAWKIDPLSLYSQ